MSKKSTKKYIIISGDDYEIISQAKKEKIDSIPPQELIKVGGNYVYRKNAKIYEEGSQAFNKILQEKKVISSEKNPKEEINNQWGEYLREIKTESPHDKTLRELHGRYGFYIATTIHRSDLFVGHVKDNKVQDSFMDDLMLLWREASLNPDSLNILYDRLIDFFEKNPNEIYSPAEWYRQFKSKISTQ